MCSCETHYFVQPCGSPSESQSCFSCNLPIGAVNNQVHTLVPRKDHCRVFKNAIHKDSIHKAWAGYADSTFPFKLTEDLKAIVDKRIKEAKADFAQIPKEEIMH